MIYDVYYFTGVACNFRTMTAARVRCFRVHIMFAKIVV